MRFQLIDILKWKTIHYKNGKIWALLAMPGQPARAYPGN
jgi:hypothetical protein